MAASLQQLARKQFNELSEVELRFVEAVSAGADFVGDDPTGPTGPIRAVVIRWLCTDVACAKYVHARGIRMVKSEIEGALELQFVNIDFPVIFEHCSFDQDVDFSNAKLPHLRFFTCQMQAVTADQIEISGSLILSETRFEGRVSLRGCRLKDNLRLFGSQLRGRDGPSLNLQGASIGGALIMTGEFLALNGVRIFGATIQRNLEGEGTIFAKTNCLLIELTKIGGSVLLRRGFRGLGGVRIYESEIAGSLDMQAARLASRGDLPALLIYGSSIAKSVLLRRDMATADGSTAGVVGPVVVQNSVVGGNLDLTGTQIRASRKDALNLFDATVRGRLRANGLDLTGRVVLTRAKIANDIEFTNAKLVSEQDTTLLGVALDCGGSMYLNGADITGRVNLAYLSLASDLRAESITIRVPKGTALALRSARIGGFADLQNAKINGIDFQYGTTGSDIMLDGAELTASTGTALVFDNGRCNGSIAARKSTCSGRFSLASALIARNLDLSGSTISVDGGMALNADSTTIGGGLSLADGFVSRGKVAFNRASIAGNVELGPCRMHGRAGSALSFRAAKIGGEFYASMRGPWGHTRLLGTLDLSYASIGDDVDLSEAQLLHRRGTTLSLRRASVKGSLYLNDKFRTNGTVDLRGAEVHGIEDDEPSWPRPSRLLLDGLSYTRLMPLTPHERLRWIALQPDSGTAAPSWQPFEQMTKILRQQGRERDARTVLLAKERAATRKIEPRVRRWLSWLYGWAMGYGYQPQRALVAVVPLVAIMSVSFYLGADALMVPTNDPARIEWAAHHPLPMGYPRFNPIAYSVDMLVPILSLQQRDAWRPAAENECGTPPWPCGLALRIGLWFYIAFGWVITTLAVAGFAGLVRRT